jgi:hexaprenyl-diphosphate synthase
MQATTHTIPSMARSRASLLRRLISPSIFFVCAGLLVVSLCHASPRGAQLASGGAFTPIRSTRSRVATGPPRHVPRSAAVGKFRDMVSRVPSSFQKMVPDIVLKGADRVNNFYKDIHELDNALAQIGDTSHLSSNGVKPLEFIKKDLDIVGQRISGIFDQDHPILRSVTEYFFKAGGKRIRPVMVMCMARALLAHLEAKEDELPADVRVKTTTEQHALPTMIQLSQITELIHTASLFHDDIIDVSDTRRGQQTVNSAFGNRVAVLSGDFLLARSAVLLAELEDPRVISGMATSIEHLCGGELLQIKSTKNDRSTFAYYIEKTFYKTGSLMAYACQSAAQLAGASDELVEAAYRYGGYVGIAFQIVDDLLDLQQDAATTGKPVGADMQNGHATAPVLYAMEEFPELKPLVERRFKNEGDAEKGLELVMKSQGIEKTNKLVEYYQNKALESISMLHSSDARDALVGLTELIVKRKS